MSRRRRAEKREVAPDYKFGSILVTKFVNSLMYCGKRRIAEDIFYTAVEGVAKAQGLEPIVVFKKAIENIKPQLEVKSRRVGGANYQVPIEVAPARANALAIRWLITFSRKRSEHSMAERLGAEVWQAYNNEGGAVRKKVETHKMAEANKAFAHFRW